MMAFNWTRPLIMGLGAVLLGCAGTDQGAHEPGMASPDQGPPSHTYTMFANCGDVRNWRSEHPVLFRTKGRYGQWELDIERRTPICTACLEVGDTARIDTDWYRRVAELGYTNTYLIRLKKGPGIKELELETLQHVLFEVTQGDTLQCAFVIKEGFPNAQYDAWLVGFVGARDRVSSKLMIKGPGMETTEMVFGTEELGAYFKLAGRGQNT